MTIIAYRLKCDMKDFCTACNIYLIPPKQQKSYFHCSDCNRDIVCDRALIQEFRKEKEGRVIRVTKCAHCNSEDVEERMWGISEEQIN